MDVRLIDLDGSLPSQTDWLVPYRPTMVPAQDWGPAIRMACSFGRFRRFERHLASLLGSETDPSPVVSLYGSGDFHHVSLALLRRQVQPFNLLILDNHPDWMRGVPFLHCGTWVHHACRLPLLQRVFHVGGEVDFDNYYRWMAPWKALQSGQITVFPALRRFQRGRWSGIVNHPLRQEDRATLCPDHLDRLLRPFRAELVRHPLYISVDKDVLKSSDAIVNWDSGHLGLTEVQTVLRGFLQAAGGRLAGMDLLGDWSPVRLRGPLRRLLHWTEHPHLAVNARTASRCNERTNGALLETVLRALTDARRLAS
jgi:hypothetical protein